MLFRIFSFSEVTSTNLLALDLAAKGQPEGLVIVADYQTSGRGKPGRKWISPAGKNLLFSLLLKPSITPDRAPLITQIACRSVASVLNRQYKILSTFKRPNDIMVNGKKICGILTEAQSSSSGQLESVVIGFGLNVNSPVEELIPEATSLKELTQKEHCRETLLKEILEQLKTDIQEIYAYSS